MITADQIEAYIYSSLTHLVILKNVPEQSTSKFDKEKKTKNKIWPADTHRLMNEMQVVALNTPKPTCSLFNKYLFSNFSYNFHLSSQFIFHPTLSSTASFVEIVKVSAKLIISNIKCWTESFPFRQQFVFNTEHCHCYRLFDLLRPTCMHLPIKILCSRVETSNIIFVVHTIESIKDMEVVEDDVVITIFPILKLSILWYNCPCR